AKRRVLRPSQAAAALVDAAARGPVAMIAGRESMCLTSAVCDLCHALVAISTAPGHRWLKLAQAVAIMAYETWNARGGESLPIKPPRNPAGPATSGPLEELFA